MEKVRVIVEVNGGCVSNVISPDFVDVHVLDWDNLLESGAETQDEWESLPEWVRDTVERNYPEDFAKIKARIAELAKP